MALVTHSHYKLAGALAYRPSYISLGPIFPTISKVMPWPPQAVNRLKEWQIMLSIPCQLVDIGGINLSNISAVTAVGINNIALISAITTAQDPTRITQELLQKLKNL